MAETANPGAATRSGAEAMIAIRGLTKQFGTILAVDGVSFGVARGEVLGFLGPNGAGKSTTMKMATGFLAPTAGTATICGFEIQDKPIEAKRHIGYLPEGAPAYPDMTPAGFLDFCASIRGISGADKRRRITDVVDRIDLGEVLHQPIDTLSKGFKRRVGLAQALVHDPDVLILDEPTDGLDPNQKHEVRALIQELSARKAIVISTHILEEVHAVCSRAIVIARGKIVADDTPAGLESRSRHFNAVSVTIPVPMHDAARAELIRHNKVAAVEAGPVVNGAVTLLVIPKNGVDIVGDVGGTLRARQWPFDQIRVEQGRLDDVFRILTLPQS
ncbi:ABC-2 type transport system ATP-binding protein [Stella humosa]|uniref:ABC-2 type transport system ATP-binding protein n=1 Tax=Stella humosa TaxID=94 RepID=A0A3N1L0B6_9PROT|nr:ABC transporter ATP-binding protein [Stella humosa]ROP84380.1 ABC-2 type transport system ATP-binding protein [Stella humosa]BBK33896.1 ABC transporter ATP-binding protein [Stella humosa]